MPDLDDVEVLEVPACILGDILSHARQECELSRENGRLRSIAFKDFNLGHCYLPCAECPWRLTSAMGGKLPLASRWEAVLVRTLCLCAAHVRRGTERHC